MITTHLDLTYTIIWSLALANILGAIFCICFTRPISLLTYIKFSVLTPIILTLILFAAYQATRSLGDFVLLGVVATIGVMMKGANWPRPAFLIGFVLSSGAENYFFQSIQFYGYSWFLRPGVITIAALIIIGFVLPPILKKRTQKNDVKTEPTPQETKKNNIVKTVSWTDWGIIAILSVCATYALVNVWDASMLTKAFPIIAIVIVLLSVIMIVSKYIKEKHTQIPSDLTMNLVYIAGFFVVAYSYYLFGFISTTFVFSLLFLKLLAKTSFLKAATIAISLVIFLVTIGRVMNVDFPEGFFDPYLLSAIKTFI
jgi:hypothetical protein